MYTTLENESLRLREDVVSDGNRRHVMALLKKKLWRSWQIAGLLRCKIGIRRADYGRETL